MNPTENLLVVRMQLQAERWEAQGDHRADFLRCYSMMTAAMQRGLEAGRFEDNYWVDQLMHRFATYYFDALSLYDQQHPATPAVWQQAHDATREQKMNVLQHLLMGINAHINYDLALALYDGLQLEWPVLTETQRRVREQDHQTVNRIIGETIDAVQDEVIKPRSRTFALVDQLMGRMDEWLLSQLITGWRSNVWEAGVDLLNAGSPERREAIRIRLEAQVLERGKEIMTLI
jgi:hypothetical protein